MPPHLKHLSLERRHDPMESLSLPKNRKRYNDSRAEIARFAPMNKLTRERVVDMSEVGSSLAMRRGLMGRGMQSREKSM
jgi:hypothetical protein